MGPLNEYGGGRVTVISLQSGSNGNCLYVEYGETRLLFDAGISGARAEQRLARFGRDVRAVDALVLSHEHRDHVCCAGVYQRKFGLPIYATEKTLAAASARQGLGRLTDVRHFRAGDTLAIDGVRIETVRTAHDGIDGAAFVVEADGARIGLMTDLGCVFDGLGDVIASLDAVMIESNYDPEMLAAGPYPPHLQERIRGPGGHLSNAEAAELLRDCAPGSLRWACLSHLSETNNTPSLALRTHESILSRPTQLIAASRGAPVLLPEL
ncbi:MAG: MBL fold metallo-hydrolase [Planctomycetota bacterium]